VFDGLQAQLAANRSQFYRDVPAGPFYGYNRPGAKVSEAVIQNWWRQGMMGGAKACTPLSFSFGYRLHFRFRRYTVASSGLAATAERNEV
jgi:hypothetical protein